eukprot:2350543-Amphidinium_carterae.1
MTILRLPHGTGLAVEGALLWIPRAVSPLSGYQQLLRFAVKCAQPLHLRALPVSVANWVPDAIPMLRCCRL